MTISIENNIAFFRTMQDDINRCVVELNKCPDGSDHEFWRRMYVRAFSTMVEGQLWMYKTLIKSMLLDDKSSITIEWLLYFTENDWRIDAKGDIELFDKKLSTKANLKCFYRQVQKFVPGLHIDISGSGWENLMYFYDIRDRLTHPSDVAHLKIDKDSILRIENAREWLVQCTKDINSHMLKILHAAGKS